MPSCDAQGRELEIRSPLSRCDESVESKAVSCKLTDLAELAGVSTATVSRVMNGCGKVSIDTRTKVLSAISKLKYSPNAHAAELGRANTGVRRNRGTGASSSVRQRERPDIGM